jgi:hypothetical protein
MRDPIISSHAFLASTWRDAVACPGLTYPGNGGPSLAVAVAPFGAGPFGGGAALVAFAAFGGAHAAARGGPGGCPAPPRSANGDHAAGRLAAVGNASPPRLRGFRGWRLT